MTAEASNTDDGLPQEHVTRLVGNIGVVKMMSVRRDKKMGRMYLHGDAVQASLVEDAWAALRELFPEEVRVFDERQKQLEQEKHNGNDQHNDQRRRRRT